MWVLLCARERTAIAEAPSGEAPPRHVEIKMVSPQEDRPLVAVLTELLDRLQVTTHFATVPDLETEEMWIPHPGSPAAVARAWIDMREPKLVTLYLTGDQQDRVLVRQVPLVTKLDEVAREEIAHIVEAAVDELLLGGQIGVEKKHAPELPPSAKLPPPLPEPPLRLDIGFGYAVQAWETSRPPLHGPALFASLSKKAGPWRPGVWVTGELRFPDEKKSQFVNLTLNQGAIRLLFTADRTVSARWIARAGVGGGVDRIHIEPTAVTESGYVVATESARTLWAPVLRGLAVARYAFTSKSELFFGASVDIDLQDTRYLIRRESSAPVTSSNSSVLDPWRFRPMALIGITADVLSYQ